MQFVEISSHEEFQLIILTLLAGLIINQLLALKNIMTHKIIKTRKNILWDRVQVAAADYRLKERRGED